MTSSPMTLAALIVHSSPAEIMCKNDEESNTSVHDDLVEADCTSCRPLLEGDL